MPKSKQSKQSKPNLEEAGTLKADGYLYVDVGGVDYPVHKLIYLLEHGELPDTVIHLNGNKLDNRIQNLQAV